MRPPRFRLRTLMIAVAVVGIFLGGRIGIVRNRERFERRAIGYSLVGTWSGYVAGRLAESDAQLPTTIAWSRWHLAMARKYERAARYHWLPVPPDPPAPPSPPHDTLYLHRLPPK